MYRRCRIITLKAPLIALALTLLSFNAYAEDILSEQWMEVRFNGRKIGFTYQKIAGTEKGYVVSTRTLMKLDVGGVVQDISSSQTYFLGPDLRPERFSYMQKMLNNRQYMSGAVKGDELDITVRSGGNVSRRTVPFDGKTYLADAVNFMIGKKKLKEGEEYTYKVFLEPLMATEEIRVKIGKKIDFRYDGKMEKVWEVESTFKNFKVFSYVSEDGRILREVSPMGFESLAVREAQAMDFSDVVPFTDILTYSLIPTKEALERQEDISLIKATVSGLSDGGLIPSDSRQTVSNVKRVETGGSGFYRADIVLRRGVKVKRRMQRPVSAKGFEEYLKPTFEAQSDDSRIVKKAREIVGSESDAYEAAMKINRWVHKNVKKKFVDTFSAVGTLETMEGECQSHTNLFTALARASGIPTRTISGIVYSREFGGFLYHAWPEIYAGDWIPVDPTFGQDAVDATHIKLIEGDLSAQLQIFEFIGKIGIDIRSVEYDR